MPSSGAIWWQAKISRKADTSGGGRRAATPTAASEMITGAKSQSSPLQGTFSGFGNSRGDAACRLSDPANTLSQPRTLPMRHHPNPPADDSAPKGQFLTFDHQSDP